MSGRILSNLLRVRKIILRESNITHRSRLLTYSQTKHFLTTIRKELIDENKVEDNNNLVTRIPSKHKVFQDEDVKVILDVDEEQQRILLDDLSTEEITHNPYKGLDLEHGTTGVFDIEDLVAVLQKDNAKDIFVATVPPEYSYVDYIVITAAKSQKHMSALATFVRKVYKLKMHKNDIIPKIEGANSKDWIALDLGNIALHIFSPKARKHYDLETLWSVGPEYDDETHKQEKVDIMEEYNSLLQKFQPVNS